jgi:hypothetical protein
MQIRCCAVLAFFCLWISLEAKTVKNSDITPVPLTESPVQSYLYLFSEPSTSSSTYSIEEMKMEEDDEITTYNVDGMRGLMEILRDTTIHFIEAAAQSGKTYSKFHAYRGSIIRWRIPLKKKIEEIQTVSFSITEYDGANGISYFRISLTPDITKATPIITDLHKQESSNRWVTWKATLSAADLAELKGNKTYFGATVVSVRGQ